MRSALAELIQDSDDVDVLDAFRSAAGARLLLVLPSQFHPTMLQGFFQYDVVGICRSSTRTS